jgi:hypothetical protein
MQDCHLDEVRRGVTRNPGQIDLDGRKAAFADKRDLLGAAKVGHPNLNQERPAGDGRQHVWAHSAESALEGNCLGANGRQRPDAAAPPLVLGDDLGQGKQGPVCDQLLGKLMQGGLVRAGAGTLSVMGEMRDPRPPSTSYQARAARRAGAAASQPGGDDLGTDEAAVWG